MLSAIAGALLTLCGDFDQGLATTTEMNEDTVKELWQVLNGQG
ncbi:hypothetical protein [Paenibacillus sp. NPDC055715]